MRRFHLRQAVVLLLPALLILVLFLILGKWAAQGSRWAGSVYNRSIYEDGLLRYAEILDRNNLPLAFVKNGSIQYPADRLLREATVHCVGDKGRNIKTGALSLYGDELISYSMVEGTVPMQQQGGRLTLSIDAELNKTAYEALQGRSGVVAVCDYTTGELLCLVSAPGFDPGSEHPELSQSQRGEYVNRFTGGLYTPGSIFKLVTGAAALEQIQDISDFTYLCEGTCNIGGNEVKCPLQHGMVTLEDALAVSCNCCFAELSVRLGAETLGAYAEAYGLCGGVTLDGLALASGSYHSDVTDPLELAWSGIGQARDEINPAAFLRFLTAIPNQGEARELSLLKGGNGKVSGIMEPETAEKLRSMMQYTAAKTYGHEKFPGLRLYAKSGTAEVGGDLKPHSWFVGFLEDPDTPYAFVVIVENGGWGITAAGDIANRVLQAAVSR